jgi:hypothetical protein
MSLGPQTPKRPKVDITQNYYSILVGLFSTRFRKWKIPKQLSTSGDRSTLWGLLSPSLVRFAISSHQSFFIFCFSLVYAEEADILGSVMSKVYVRYERDAGKTKIGCCAGMSIGSGKKAVGKRWLELDLEV